jgi:hypothetical protein
MRISAAKREELRVHLDKMIEQGKVGTEDFFVPGETAPQPCCITGHAFAFLGLGIEIWGGGADRYTTTKALGMVHSHKSRRELQLVYKTNDEENFSAAAALLIEAIEEFAAE